VAGFCMADWLPAPPRAARSDFVQKARCLRELAITKRLPLGGNLTFYVIHENGASTEISS